MQAAPQNQIIPKDADNKSYLIGRRPEISQAPATPSLLQPKPSTEAPESEKPKNSDMNYKKLMLQRQQLQQQ